MLKYAHGHADAAIAGHGKPSRVAAAGSVDGLALEFVRMSLRWSALAFAAAVCLVSTIAAAHPHVWVTVRSQVMFSPDGKVSAVMHDWVFDEMYSSFATQGLAKPGELVMRDAFAPLAKENAGGLADIGYFTTLKLDGKAVEFGPVTEYWMEERPDHLVAFHVVLPLKKPTAVGRFGSLLVADPEFFIDFEFDDKDGVLLKSAPSGCSTSFAKPKELDGGDKKTLDESFFTGLAPGANFGFKMASRVILACP
jgi:ABC-type uncharacterized transport system substrate-binding protein